MNVILVHGFLDTGGVMGRLARHLTHAGHHCLLPSLKPNDGRKGLPKLAEQLQGFIDSSLGTEERFALVGFSMGALISRYYLQELDGHRRTESFFSISGPHSGTWTAYFYPSRGVVEMRPGSKFLQQLDQSVDRLGETPITCYWTPYDLMILPASSCRWNKGDAVLIPSLLHRWMVSDQHLHDDLLKRLDGFSK